MATRRSRIKAVANLPARRSRPIASNDSKSESLECGDDTSVLSPSHHNGSPFKPLPAEGIGKDESQCLQPESGEISQTTPDRKSVIVTIEKDRKSVIVNRDNCISTAKSLPTHKVDAPPVGNCDVQDASENIEVGSKDCQSAIDDKGVECNDKKNTSVITTKAPDSSKDTVDSNGSQNKHVSTRMRRAKPTVNLTAATRKRPSNDPCTPSVGSPPPCKLRCPEFQHRKASECEIKNETVIVAKPCEKNDDNQVPEACEQSILRTNPTPLPSSSSLDATPGSPLPSNSPSSISTEFFVTPSGPVSKSKDPTFNATSDQNVKGDAPGVATPVSPQKEPNPVKRKSSANAQRVAAARKSLKNRLSIDGPPSRASLTMFDLIFYNPSKNPMKSTESLPTKARGRINSVSSIASIHEDRLCEESVDDVEVDKTKEDAVVEETVMPVPQVKVGPDGSLILDEQSLVIETTGTKKSLEELERSEIVVDTGSGHGYYKKIVRSKDWSDHETKKFYRALNVVGTDFSLMKPYFRNRTRRELKLKFKKEERLNTKLITKALAEPLDFDISELEKECELEDEEEKRLEELAKEKAADKSDDNIPDLEEQPKKQAKKKRMKASRLFSEMAELQGDWEGSSSAPARPAPKSVVKKIKKDPNADKDYESLSVGVAFESETITRKEPSVCLDVQTEDDHSIVVDLPVKTVRPPVKRIRKKKIPVPVVAESQEPNAEEIQELKTKTINCPPKPGVVVPTKKTLPSYQPECLSTPKATTVCRTVSAGAIGISKLPVNTVKIPMVTSSQASHAAPLNVSSNSLVSSLSPNMKVVMSNPLSRIQIVQTSPLSANTSSAPLPIGDLTSPRTIKIIQRPVVNNKPSVTIQNKNPISPSLLNIKASPPTLSAQTAHGFVSPLPSSSTCIVPNIGPKLVSPTHVSRMRPVQITPQSAPNLPGFGVTTPVSRLLPSTPPLPRMEPGSIIVLKTPLPQDPDRHVLQVYMVTNTPQITSPNTAPHTPTLSSINLLSGPSVQPANLKSPCLSDDSDCEKVLTKL